MCTIINWYNIWYFWWFILLDNITDPQNFGSILRSAAAFNVKLIIAQNINSPHESASLASAASGALDLVSICREKNITKSIHILKENGWWIFGLDMPTENHYKELSNFNHDLNKVVIVLGSEGKGIRRLIKNNCDEIVCININSNIINSLNVSNAAAIALYSFSK